MDNGFEAMTRGASLWTRFASAEKNFSRVRNKDLQQTVETMKLPGQLEETA
jgi:hypothetical protein